MDGIWARYYEQIYPMGNFTLDFMRDKMLHLDNDYYNATVAGDPTSLKLWMTGCLTEVLKRFEGRVKGSPIKYAFYSDHDDAIMDISTAF